LELIVEIWRFEFFFFSPQNLVNPDHFSMKNPPNRLKSHFSAQFFGKNSPIKKTLVGIQEMEQQQLFNVKFEIQQGPPCGCHHARL
jgi:hypothetical protein